MRLGIVIRDKEYRTAILEMISEFDKEIFVEVADRSVAGRESVILTDILPEELNSEQLDSLKNRTVFLTSSRQNTCNGVHKAFKYGDVSEIISELYLTYSEWSGETEINHLLSKTIAVCSSNDAFASEQCMTLARAIIYAHGGSVLILPLGYINDYLYRGSDDESSFRRMMYLIDSEKNFPIECFTHSDSYGISFLKMSDSLNPVASLDNNYLQKLIHDMCGRFDTVIFDIGTCYKSENINVIAESDTIICLKNSRINSFREIIGEASYERAKFITEDGTKDMSIILTEMVSDIYKSRRR